MKLVNNSSNNFIYVVDNRTKYLLNSNETLEVPERVAKCFLKNKGVSVVEEQPKEEVKTKKKTTKKTEE